MACKGSGVQIPSAPPQVRGPVRPRPSPNRPPRAADRQQSGSASPGPTAQSGSDTTALARTSPYRALPQRGTTASLGSTMRPSVVRPRPPAAIMITCCKPPWPGSTGSSRHAGHQAHATCRATPATKDHPRLPTLAGCRLADGPTRHAGQEPSSDWLRNRRLVVPVAKALDDACPTSTSLTCRPADLGSTSKAGPCRSRYWVTTDIAASLWTQDLGRPGDVVRGDPRGGSTHGDGADTAAEGPRGVAIPAGGKVARRR
jgi:hypothetical protein